MTHIVTFGGSGYVGNAICKSLSSSNHDVVPASAPRLSWNGKLTEDGLFSSVSEQAVSQVANVMRGSDVVINAAGLTDPALDSHELIGANALLPLVLLRACQSAGVKRFIHVSSAAVQGRMTLNEDAHTNPVGTYATSKALGETMLRMAAGKRVQLVIYRPTSVQGPGRQVTARIRSLASSPLSICARRGDDPTPQVHIDNVGIACSHLSSERTVPPTVVLHPWEGWTTRTFLRSLSGQEPRLLPRGIARLITSGTRALTKISPSTSPSARRLELLLLGQDQASGWFDTQKVDWVARFSEWRSDESPWDTSRFAI